MNNYGMKIMKKGKDITSDNVLDYIFWSKYPSLNVKKRGTISVTTTDDSFPSPVTNSIEHGFGYIPQYMAFTRSYLSENYSKFAFADYVNLDFYMEHEDAGANILETVDIYLTNTDIVVSANLYSAVSGDQTGIIHTYDIDYVLFMEEARPI
jgi:hypothetical protein